MRVRLDRDGEGASQTEVRNLDHVLGLIDEEVLGLEVAVHDAVAVDVRAPEAQLVHEVLHDFLLEGVRRTATGEVHETLEVLVEVLEDEVEHGLAVLLDVLHLEQPDFAREIGRRAGGTSVSNRDGSIPRRWALLK